MKNIVFLILLITSIGQAQNTIALSEGEGSPKASLEDVSWIAGHWKGEAFGGIVEEFWSPPLGDSMMFAFKHVADNSVGFYEIGHIKQLGETLILQLKHFHGNLEAWEEKEETVDFKLVKLEAGRAYFDNYTFERISADEMNLYVVIGQQDGSKQEVKFNYKREQ